MRLSDNQAASQSESRMGFEKWVMYVRISLTTNECILGMNVGWMDGRMDGDISPTHQEVLDIVYAFYTFVFAHTRKESDWRACRVQGTD